MQSLKTKIVELQEEIAQAKRRDRDAALRRISGTLAASFIGMNFEDGMHAMAHRLSNNLPTPGDIEAIAACSPDDIVRIGMSPAQYVCLTSQVMSKY